MANDTTITVIGNMTADPELRYTPNGAAVSNFTIASTPRTFDKQRNEWVDGETMFLRCNVWRDMAENVADSLAKGMRVIAQGRLKSRTFDTKEGERRTVFELDVDEIGPSLLFARAQVAKAGRGGQMQGSQQAQGGWGNPSQQGQPQGQYGQGGYAQQGGGWATNPTPQTTHSPWDAPQDAQNSPGAPSQA